MDESNVKEYTDYKGERITIDWGKPASEEGCLELLILLPLIGVMYYVYQILSG